MNSVAGIVVQVLTAERTFLTDQALVRVRNLTAGTDAWRVTRYRSEALFDNLVPGNYEIEVSAAGYGTVVQPYNLLNSFNTERVTVVLKRDGSVPTFTPAPISGVPQDVRKETERGIEALKARQFGPAEKHLLKASKRYPDNADLNYLLAALRVEKKDMGGAKTYLEKSLAANPKHVRALTTMGRVLLQQKDASVAIPYLEQAVALEPEQWLPHWLLATGYLRTGQYEKAEPEARSALRTGKGAANAARLPLGQSLAFMGRYPEAIEELEGFVRDVPGSPLVAEIRRLIADLKAALAQGSTASPAAVARVSSPAGAASSAEAALAVPNWGPPGIDDVKPFVASGVACPEQRVVAGAADRLQELIRDLARFEATEDVVHEDVDELGQARTRETRQYSYVAEISEPLPGVPRVTEYRHALSGVATFPGGIATLGLPSIAFVLQPKSRDNYQLTCEGLGQWQNQATWLIHFRQRENRPSYLLGYNLGDGIQPVDLQGRIWVVADTFQVVRVEAESIRPLPGIRLLSQHMTVDYGRVSFPQKNGAELWLPQKAELYFQFRGHRYHRIHSFGNFRLFAVDSSEKVKQPPINPQP